MVYSEASKHCPPGRRSPRSKGTTTQTSCAVRYRLGGDVPRSRSKSQSGVDHLRDARSGLRALGMLRGALSRKPPQECPHGADRTSTTHRRHAPGLFRSLRSLARWIALLVFAAFFGFPLYWTVTMAFKPPVEWNPPGKVVWLPEHPTLSNFDAVLGIREQKQSIFLQQPTRSAIGPIENSLIAASGGTLIALATGCLAAYAIARFRASGRLFPFLLLQLRLVPILVFAIPLFLANESGVLGTVWGLALVYGAVTLPIAVWLLRGFFRALPRELTEAAIVDGCSHWGAFLKVMLPQLKAAIATTALVVFLLNWSDFVIASFLTDNNSQTATVFLSRLQADELERQYGHQAALALLLMLPPIALAYIAHRILTGGLAFGVLRKRTR